MKRKRKGVIRMSMAKKLFATLLVAITLLSITAPALAAPQTNGGPDEIIVTPMWTYLSTVYTWMGIDSSGKATMVSTIDAYSGVTSVKMTNYLQRYESGAWRNVTSWTQTDQGIEGLWSKTYYVYSGYNYRLKTYFYAYVGTSLVESTSLVSGTVSY
jgi:hypothetical protein